jgi:D-amino peptidase
MEPFYRGFDAAILVGHHAMAGTPDGILSHTMSSRRGDRYWLNGREMGETGMFAVLLGYFGVPIVMATGDEASCREATDLLGEGIVCVSVKQGFATEYGLLLAPQAAHRLIREGAKDAVTRVSECVPFVLEPPVHGRVRFPDKSAADGFRPRRAYRVDDYTFEVDFERACDVLEF